MSGSDGGGGDGVGATEEWVQRFVRRIFHVDNLDTLQKLGEFAKNPVTYLRGRIIPLFVGWIFQITFNVADAIARPFEAAGTAANTAVDAVLNALWAVTTPLIGLVEALFDGIAGATSGLGPLQPFVTTALGLLLGYLVIVASVRLLRAVLDSIPVLSGVETFLSR